MSTEAADSVRYVVVLNDEEQYSIWPAAKPVPAGWYKDAKEGTKEECLQHIEVVWTDITPKSLRRPRAD